MIRANMGPGGIITATYSVPKGGRITEDVNLAYLTPYQQKYAGRLVEFATASGFDSSITNDYLVVKPVATLGKMPIGYLYKTTRDESLLEGASAAYLPSDAAVALNGYATDESLFQAVAVVPLKEGMKVGIPVGANVNIPLGSEIMSDASGFATVAASTKVVIGHAENAVDNSSGAAGAAYVAVRLCGNYIK